MAVDLAQTVFEPAFANAQWHIVTRQRLNRRQFARFLAQAPATHVVMEACGTAPHWGRVAQHHGHQVSLLPAGYVLPYVHRNKTDRADADALLEAVRSGEIPRVPVKRVIQQALVGVHRVREQWMTTRLLVGNPGSSDATLSVTYLLPDGTSLVKPYDVAAQSRLTIGVDGEDASLQATALSIVRSTNNVPVVVERALWWPSPTWYEGSLSAATTVKGRRWAMADGPISGGAGTFTYLLIANPGDTAGSVTIAFVDGTSATPRCTSTVPVAAHSRTTFDIGTACGTALQGAAHNAATITSDGPAIVVERSTYVSSPTRFWTAGGSAILTPLPEPSTP